MVDITDILNKHQAMVVIQFLEGPRLTCSCGVQLRATGGVRLHNVFVTHVANKIEEALK